ncbi:hypothetical protein BDF14DRAFT_1700333, partial [Spinellus fusiger]
MATAIALAIEKALGGRKPSGEQMRQPECYNGERAANVLNGWLRMVDHYTNYHGHSSQRKAQYMVNLLRGRAETWWQRMEEQE